MTPEEYVPKKVQTAAEKKRAKAETEEEMLESDLAFRQEEFEFWKYEDAPEIIKEGSGGAHFKIGFSRIDNLLGGVGKGELIVMTGPTGVGKTTAAQSFTWRMAQNGVPSLWFTLEVSLANFLRPFVGHDQEARYEATAVDKLLKVSSQPIYFPKHLEQVSWRTLKAMIWAASVEHHIGAVFIDHLHYLVRLHERQAVMENFSLYIGDRVRELRRIALETGVTVFLIAHLTKVPDGKRPTLNDLRDSSFIGQEADAVLVLWRNRMKNSTVRMIGGEKFDDPWSRYTEIGIEKARRTGARGELTLQWDRGLYSEARYEDVQAYYQVNPKYEQK